MGFGKPQDVRRSFAKDSKITKFRVPAHSLHACKEKRVQRTNFWSGGRLDYEFLERCKEIVCRIQHPTGYYRHKKVEYRLSVLRWSRGSYVDIRQYHDGMPSPTGILLHLDIISELLPELVSTVRQLQLEDTRDDDKKAKIEVIRA